MRSTSLIIALALAIVAPAGTQTAEGAGGSTLLAKQIAPARQNARLTVRSGSFIPGGAIPDRHSKDGGNVSPPLQWSKGPPGTRSYAIIAEDAGTVEDEPIVHWVIYDIDGAARQIGSDVSKTAKTENGASQAKNSDGSMGYTGPSSEQGKISFYHFQVFALNSKLNLDPETADRDAITEAMKGKVLASGDLIGRYTGK